MECAGDKGETFESVISRGSIADSLENASFLPQAALDLITSAVLDKCDAIDGVIDRLIENPLSCSFDIKTLACGAPKNNTSSCLTDAQVAAAEAIYAGPKDVRTGQSLYPGFSYGSETEWLLQEGLLAAAFSIPLLQNLVYDNLQYDPDTFNWGTDVDVVDRNAGVFIDEITPDLSAFARGGGKMIVAQGKFKQG